jgi:hypothetical protein
MPTKNAIGSNIPIEVSKGGTGVTSYTSSGIVKYDGTNIPSSAYALIDSNNYYLNSKQPNFFATLSAPVSNVSGTGTLYSIVFDSEVWDNASNYNPATGIFTAPVDGIYLFNAIVYVTGCTISTSISLNIVTSGYTFYSQRDRAASALDLERDLTILAKLTAGQTAYVSFSTSGEAADTNDLTGASSDLTSFSGYLVC